MENEQVERVEAMKALQLEMTKNLLPQVSLKLLDLL